MATDEELTAQLLSSYRSDLRGQRIGKRFLPSRDEIAEVIGLLLEIFYPGYFGRQDLTQDNIEEHTQSLIASLRQPLRRQIEACLCHAAEEEQVAVDADCTPHARRVTEMLLLKLPEIRATLVLDAEAAFDGDPAATGLDEVILSYPGFLAVTVYRVAHELYTMGVPFMPRIMTEWAHSRTGTDIHPGAQIGASFFVDHATGVVIGETTTIGQRVKLYQGVTLGALSHPKDAQGRVIRNTKRHPSVEDDVTIYANATVLGGNTVLGQGSVVGGSVFVTQSVPAGSRITIKPPELTVQPPKKR